MTEKYSVLLGQDRRPIVIRGVLWVFSPEKAEEVAQKLGYTPSQPLEYMDVWRLVTRLKELKQAEFASFAPDHLPPSALGYPNTAIRHKSWEPSRWAFDDLFDVYPVLRPIANLRAIELMSAPREQFTAHPPEIAPDEYAPSGELLRAQRERAGLTQAALAEKAGLDIRVVERLEGEHRKPHSETIRRLAKALGIPRAKLLGSEFDQGVKVENEVPFDPEIIDRDVWYYGG
jgi:DNA-binding XRE family transcriptional regulator